MMERPTAPIRIVALDMDGTVLDSRKLITPRTMRALQAALDAGVEVLPCTGRIRDGLPEQLGLLHGMHWGITCDGAQIWQMSEEHPRFEIGIERSVTLRLLDFLLALPDAPATECYFGRRAYTSRADLARAEEYFVKPDYLRRTRTPTDDLRATAAAAARPCVKTHLMFRPDQLELRRTCQDVLGRWPELTVTSAVPTNLEITARGADKGRALLRLGEMLQVPVESIMACGDNLNDTAMLAAAGFSVLMGNGHPDMKSTVDYVTASNDEDGIALALERFVL